ncbi:FecR family protein [Pedobacter nyackensis]|uniref:FecR family protein n=1 Tax=Pedobacter nyackensis TaxID=475255 RepID=A0A1W2F1K8_9SPHI|nr:FecR family protein [Pedobacter nyackensis]SMD15338.1 FecR family protein [Pedobacter nyackensis]
MKNAKEILSAYKAGTCTEEEKKLIEKWFLLNGAGINSDLSDRDFLHAGDDMWEMISQNKGETLVPVRRNLFVRISIAASILLVMSFSAYYFLSSSSKNANQQLVNNVVPGGNKAVLTLADGRKISLTDAGNGEVVVQQGLRIVKDTTGRVVYELPASEESIGLPVKYNTIATPNGGKYEVLLPDGSKVFLNAATTITFPTSFAGLKERKVKLNGEAYFEVVHNKSVPFKVEMNTQEIEVLGTRFNANNYADEPSVRTTLLEGAVKVFVSGGLSKEKGPNVILKPGQQAQLMKGNLNVKEVNAQTFVDWKDNVFSFYETELEEAMRQLSRWYDVKIEYKGKIPREHITGYIPRAVPISKAFLMLEEVSDMKYSLEGKKVIVSF